MNIQTAAVALLVVLTIGVVEAAEGKGSHSAAQVHFSAENDAVETPVPIPEDVLVLLRKDEMVRSAMANERISTEKIPPSWLSASAIHLSTAEKLDLVVMAEGPLKGANVTTFWVFCAAAHGYQLALTAPAHDLIVKAVSWKGYRNIEIKSLTATQISTVLFRFDGERYEEAKAELEPIR